ncbi:MAG: hypothetical protein CVU63_11285 [Deltaproteobacteria bacterium HGW-Deltaproteobacteria-20]|jgi:two-component system cell cycle sensor histidine kinase/response regulator CckA|nr:MAG: hypothetical protein CVU63_11285 [Deltaproteobacteria bacterium HGW-Deltaproteobacteria-20]
MDHSVKPRGQHSILVVDDDALVLRMTQMVLDEMGYQVDVAVSGAEALARIDTQQGAFDLVVLDQRLPDREGISVMREARKRFPDLRFMLVTGYSTDEIVRDMMDAGAIRVLDKPYDIEELTTAVETALLPSP